MTRTLRRRGSYGIDAPYAPAFMTVLAALELSLAVIFRSVWGLLAALFILTILGFYLHATLRGKFVVWAELLDRLNHRGDERILDMGGGRGAVLLMAAQHLTTGRVVGVDLWRSADQSGNSTEGEGDKAEPELRNAALEGVADRVELHDGDMTALPFEDDSFDLVLSSLAIHNIRGSAGREKAVNEAVRVLRPGGRLLIADIRATRQYQAELAAASRRGGLARIAMNDVARRRLGWQFWWGGLWAATRQSDRHRAAASDLRRPGYSIALGRRSSSSSIRK